MGIGAPISILGYTHFTKDLNCNKKSKNLREILTFFKTQEKLNHDNLRIIYNKIYPELQENTTAGIIGQNYESEKIFFNLFTNIEQSELLAKYACVFEWNNDELMEILSKNNKISIMDLILFILRDLSEAIILSVNEQLKKSHSTNFDYLKLAGLIIKIHKQYQRISDPILLEKICSKITDFIKTKKQIAPFAYKVLYLAGDLFNLEEKYHNPKNPLIPSYLVEQQKLLTSLPFWTHDAISLYSFFKAYFPEKDSLSLIKQKEICETIFYDCPIFGKQILTYFQGSDPNGKNVFDFESFIWTCMACCIDPRETFNQCLFEYFGKEIPNEKIFTILYRIAKFALSDLGKIVLQLSKNISKPIQDSLEKLINLRKTDIDLIIYELFPLIKTQKILTKDDFKICGEDSLIYRIIEKAASFYKINGKIIETEGSIMPLHLLACSSLLRETEFNLKDSIETYEIIMKNGLSKISENDLISKYFINENKEIDLQKYALSCASLCLDQNDTFSALFWNLAQHDSKIIQKDALFLAHEIIKFQLIGIYKIISPQISCYPQLLAIQQKFSEITDLQISQIIAQIMPFTKLTEITNKNQLLINIPKNQRFVYSVLNCAAEILEIPIEHNNFDIYQ